MHRVAVHFESFGRGPVAEDFGVGGEQLLDGRHVEVVVVRVGDQHDVGLRQCAVVGVGAHGIDVDVFAAHGDRERSVLEKGDREFGPVAGGEPVGGIFGGFCAAAAENGEQ